VQQGSNVAVHLVFENVLCEQGASSDTDVAAGAGLKHSSGAPLGRLALNGVHAVLLTLALAMRPVFPVHWQGMRIVDDQWCLQACTVTLLHHSVLQPSTRCLTDLLGNMRVTDVALLVLSTLPQS